MICAMSPAATRLDYVAEWKAYVAEVQQLDQPLCQWCDIHHARDPHDPYCHMRARFFARLPKWGSPKEHTNRPRIAETCPVCGGVRGLTQPERRVCESRQECLEALLEETKGTGDRP